MDGQNNPQQPTPQQVPPQQISPAPAPRSNMLIIVLVGLLMLGLGLSGGYFLFANNSQQVPNLNNQQVTQVSPTVLPSSVLSPAPSIPSDWTLQSSTSCNVDFLLPPKKAPYFIPDNPSTSADLVDEDGHFWIMENTPNKENTLLPDVSLITYRNPNAGGSGYVPGQVLVNCGLNTNKYTSEQFADVYVNRFRNILTQI